jgi:hypothetical protein
MVTDAGFVVTGGTPDSNFEVAGSMRRFSALREKVTNLSNLLGFGI